ncbi:unnamed protein product [Blepharisma stoltei]|uniref:Exophilin 5 n=1 Tax=Blepharisma stoltei TaxID=1481888 RepID=A0AAU9JK99_9CILI|nr:unnamed protein product [Blepharisma stoltei]
MGSTQGKEEVNCIIRKTLNKTAKEKPKHRRIVTSPTSPNKISLKLDPPSLFLPKNHQEKPTHDNSQSQPKFSHNYTKSEKNAILPEIKVSQVSSKVNIRFHIRSSKKIKSHPNSKIGSPKETSNKNPNFEEALLKFMHKSGNINPVFKELYDSNTKQSDPNILGNSRLSGDGQTSPVLNKTALKSFSSSKPIKSYSLPADMPEQKKVKIFDTGLESKKSLNVEARNELENPSMIFDNLDLHKISQRRKSLEINVEGEIIKRRRGSFQINFIESTEKA